jgi:uncharacterized phage protein gp47/JayE
VSGTVGINSVTNALALTNGSDQETDAQLKTRFQLFISSLSQATDNAIDSAIAAVRPNLTWQIIENLHFDGSAFVAGFTVVVDDGSGAPTLTLLNSVESAINAVRAAGIRFEISGPSVVPVNFSVHLNIAAGFNATVVQSQITTAITAVIDGYGVGNNVSYASVANAVQTTPGVTAYSALTLNGTSADIAIALTQIARIGTVAFT